MTRTHLYILGLNEMKALRSPVSKQLGGVASFTCGLVLMAGGDPRDPLGKGKEKVEDELPQPVALFKTKEVEEKEGRDNFETVEPYNSDVHYTGFRDPGERGELLDLDEDEIIPSVVSAPKRMRRVFLTGPLAEGSPSEGSILSPNNQKDMQEGDFASAAGENFWGLDDEQNRNQMKAGVGLVAGWVGATLEVAKTSAAAPLGVATFLAEQTVDLQKRNVEQMFATYEHDKNFKPLEDDLLDAVDVFTKAIPKIKINYPKEFLDSQRFGSSNVPSTSRDVPSTIQLELPVEGSGLGHASTQSTIIQTPEEVARATGEKESIVDSFGVEIHRVRPGLLKKKDGEKDGKLEETVEKPRTASEPADPRIPEEPKVEGRRQATSDPTPSTKEEPKSSSVEPVGTSEQVPTIPEVDVPFRVTRPWYQSCLDCFPFFSDQSDDENPRNPSGALSLVSSSISNCIRDHDIDQIWNQCVTHIQNLWVCSFVLSINVLLRRGLPTLLKKFPEGSPFATKYPRLYRWLQNLCETVQKNGDTVMLVFSAYIAFSAFLLSGNVWSLVNIAKKTYDFYKKNNPNA